MSELAIRGFGKTTAQALRDARDGARYLTRDDDRVWTEVDDFYSTDLRVDGPAVVCDLRLKVVTAGQS